MLVTYNNAIRPRGTPKTRMLNNGWTCKLTSLCVQNSGNKYRGSDRSSDNDQRVGGGVLVELLQRRHYGIRGANTLHTTVV